MAKKPAKKSKVGWMVACAATLGIVAGGWAIAGRSAVETPDDGLPSVLTVEGIKAIDDDPRAVREKIREAMRNEELTDEQRRAAMRNMRSFMRGHMKERVDAYYAAAEADKQALLDEQIDEFQKRMKEWQQRRKDDERSDEERQAERERRREMRQSRSQAERKADSESRNPDDMARAMAYFNAMRERMGERGIDMPGGFGRGGFGGGGSRGGGSGRGRR